MQEVLIFSGTSEGRELAEALARHNIGATVCVATEYGQEVMGRPKSGLLTVRAGRMDEKEMEKLIGGKEWRAVVDATHPFAEEVTKNIASACRSQGREALRLLREQGSQTFPGHKVVFVDTVKEAVDHLNQTAGNIFLATGSKSLAEYVGGIQDTSRIYARILPVGEEVERCRGLGLSGNQIICMQGPFSEGLNLAMMEAVQASILVTKETSKAGGFPEKLAAAKRIGAETIVLPGAGAFAGRNFTKNRSGIWARGVRYKRISDYNCRDGHGKHFQYDGRGSKRLPGCRHYPGGETDGKRCFAYG